MIRTHAAGVADTFAAVDEVAPVSEEDDDEDGPEAEALSHYESVALSTNYATTPDLEQ